MITAGYSKAANERRLSSLEEDAVAARSGRSHHCPRRTYCNAPRPFSLQLEASETLPRYSRCFFPSRHRPNVYCLDREVPKVLRYLDQEALPRVQILRKTAANAPFHEVAPFIVRRTCAHLNVSLLIPLLRQRRYVRTSMDKSVSLKLWALQGMGGQLSQAPISVRPVMRDHPDV